MKRDDLNYEDEYDDDDDSMEDVYLTFRINERDFGVDIKDVVEIVVLPSVTEVPDLPGFVKGIINLRGKVIPLVDMRTRFHIQAIDYNDKTCVIIIESNEMLVGLIVDAVSEVMKIVKDQIESSPKVGQNITSRFVDKIGKVGEEIKIILNLDKLLNEEEKAAVEDIGMSSDTLKDSEKKSKEKEQAKELVAAS